MTPAPLPSAPIEIIVAPAGGGSVLTRSRGRAVLEGADARSGALLLGMYRAQLVEQQRMIVLKPPYAVVQPPHNRRHHIDVVAQNAQLGQHALQLRGDEFEGHRTVFGHFNGT